MVHDVMQCFDALGGGMFGLLYVLMHAVGLRSSDSFADFAQILIWG